MREKIAITINKSIQDEPRNQQEEWVEKRGEVDTSRVKEEKSVQDETSITANNNISKIILVTIS